MQTFSPSVKDITRRWHLFDADGQTLGRLAVRISGVLMGKSKPGFVRHLDIADHVVVINSRKVKVSGNKSATKLYRHHSGYPGGMKAVPFASVIRTDPARIIVHAVSGMLPQNKLRDKILTHLHVYPDADHPYTQQFKSA